MSCQSFGLTACLVFRTVSASRAEANQRVLVRKTLHQLHEYNLEQNEMYLEPVTTLDKFSKNWDKYTKGLSEEEMVDME